MTRKLCSHSKSKICSNLQSDAMHGKYGTVVIKGTPSVWLGLQMSNILLFWVIFVKFSNLTTPFGSFLWKFDTPVGVKIQPMDTPVGVKINPVNPLNPPLFGVPIPHAGLGSFWHLPVITGKNHGFYRLVKNRFLTFLTVKIVKNTFSEKKVAKHGKHFKTRSIRS